MRTMLKMGGLLLVGLSMLAGCSLAPPYQRPNLNVPAGYKEASGPWQVAQPADSQSRGEWWRVYHDPQLNALEAQLGRANPSLAAMLARFDMARAYASQMRAGLYPSLDADSGILRDRQSDNRPLRGTSQPNEYDDHTLRFNLNYEVDLWGRIRNEVAAGEGAAQAAAAELASARLSLEASLADDYLQLRGYDIQTAILSDSLGVYRRGLALTQALHAGGAVSGLDVSRAQTQLAAASALVDEVIASRRLVEHAIASLVGLAPAQLTIPAQVEQLGVPQIPVGVPSTLLQRRPDIAAAERRVCAANAAIGVARAAFFPSLSLTGGFGWQNAGGNNLLTAGNRYWALGPLSALNLFDGGYRRAKLRRAHANFEAAAADYRATVLTAFREVEDNLSLLDQLGLAASDEEDAVAAAQKSQQIASNRYREGAVSYLDVVTAQEAALRLELTAQTIRTRRLQASVNLIRALGGGWQVPDSSAASTQAGMGVARAGSRGLQGEEERGSVQPYTAGER